MNRTLAAFAVALVVAPLAAADKVTPPSAAALAESVEAIKTLYKADYAKRRSGDGSPLARRLLAKAADVKDDATYRFALLKEGYDLAVLAGDTALAAQAADAMATHYRVDALVLKADALIKVAKDPSPPAVAAEALDLAYAVATDAVRADVFDQAVRVLAAAEAYAGRANQPAQRKRVADKLAAARELDAAFTTAQAALLQSQRNAGDAAAEEVVGRFLCMLKGDWTKGVTHLTRAAESPLNAAAKRDAAKPTDPKVQRELAAAWWDLAEAEQGTARVQLRARAQHWYRQAWDKLNGAPLVEAEKRLAPAALAVPEFDVEPPGAITLLRGHKGAVDRACFTPDGRRVVTSGTDGTVRVWATHSGRLTRTIEAFSQSAFGACVTPDGKTIISCGTNREVRWWDVESGREAGKLDGMAESVYCVALSPDGKRLAVGGTDRIVHLWATDTHKEVKRAAGHPGTVGRVSFAGDGKSLATVGHDGSVRVWVLPALREARVYPGHSGGGWDVAFAPDGRTVVSTGYDKVARLWDVATGKEARTWPGAYACGFSPDGRRLLAGDADGRVRVYDIASGRELAAFTGHTRGEVRSVQASADGRYAVSAGTDGDVRVWRLPRY